MTYTNETQINTQGGTYAEGDITSGGDFVGRDKIINNIYVSKEGEEREHRKKALYDGIFKRLRCEPETVLIDDGSFLMGSDEDDENEKPQREVELPDFRIGKYPVTNAQYAEFLACNPEFHQPPRTGWFLRKPPLDKQDHPVVSVSWDDAVAYCEWLSEKTARNYQLPSEAEWEKAARGTDGRCYPWGNDWQENAANINNKNTVAVADHPLGASSSGCLGMLGNVQEWTSSEADRGKRIYRGSSYRSAAHEIRCSARSASNEESKVTWRGFRVMLKIE